MSDPATRLEQIRAEVQDLHDQISDYIEKMQGSAKAELAEAQVEAEGFVTRMQTVVETRTQEVRAEIDRAKDRMGVAALQAEDKVSEVREGINAAGASLREGAQHAAQATKETISDLRTRAAAAIAPKKEPV
ncbi:hypothetical protein H9N28_09225 [Rhodobacter capsulatus]|uniref:Uncharacterized protein n=1 Tax=Rhodobacter capsulatus TaxID=1061 RepID=A0A0Q0QFD4_RHOCA|nr:hypothetical protein [Rhodobacter capsulatus]KQB12131.1 hypothetical protein AP071_07335 [Rhodobacter capsulatus]KQB12724.1 hypothetical protein AP073_06390 [Rhodobacter capsulatus]PZX23178.1 hypothetical protein LY44_02478 [Rhodobacter capsulatus]QNR61800.1 hypothetical protein H9N28_09225 [Rhodobacter capsulatus]WER10809.1 hypothetical protein PUH89_07505 [Rhodobacter capsulatus]